MLHKDNDLFGSVLHPVDQWGVIQCCTQILKRGKPSLNCLLVVPLYRHGDGFQTQVKDVASMYITSMA